MAKLMILQQTILQHPASVQQTASTQQLQPTLNRLAGAFPKLENEVVQNERQHKYDNVILCPSFVCIFLK
jgi:hypothetical protein